jgi:hypothetical protein
MTVVAWLSSVFVSVMKIVGEKCDIPLQGDYIFTGFTIGIFD